MVKIDVEAELIQDGEPDVETGRRMVEKFAGTVPLVRDILVNRIRWGWSWEQALLLLAVRLLRENARLRETAVERPDLPFIIGIES